MNNMIKVGALIGISAIIIGGINLTIQSRFELKLDKNVKDNIEIVKNRIAWTSHYSQFVNDLVLAQAILESNLVNKPSKLAVNDNNLFGIKCSQKVQKCTTYRTNEYSKGKKLSINASFAHFDSIAECINFRLDMFKMPRYKNVVQCSSFEDCAIRIQKSGYATDPTYSKQLMRIYEEYIK